MAAHDLAPASPEDRAARLTLLALVGLGLMLWGLVLDAWLHIQNPHLAMDEGLFTLSNPGHLMIFVGVGMLAVGLISLARQWLRPAAGAGPGPPTAAVSAGQRRGLTGALLAVVIGAVGVVIVSFLPHADGGGTDAQGGHSHAAVTRDGITEVAMDHDGTLSVARTAYGLASSPTLTQTLAALDMYNKVKASAQRYAGGYQLARAAGYTISDQEIQGRPSIGIVHLTNPDFARDGRLVDPERPEVLIYAIDRRQHSMLIGAMFLMPIGQHGPQFGGPMTMWHFHPNMQLCVDEYGVPMAFRVNQPCAAGQTKQSPEMLHVWLVDNPEGIFAHDMAVLPPELRAR